MFKLKSYMALMLVLVSLACSANGSATGSAIGSAKEGLAEDTIEQPGWHDFMSASQYHHVVMGKLPTGHDTVKLKMNGADGTFIIDTAAVTSINDQLQSKYKLADNQLQKTIDAAGASALIKISYYPLSGTDPQMSIFGADNDPKTSKNRAINVSFKSLGVTDLNAVTRGIFTASGVLIDGILGQDVLLSHGMILDVSKQSLFVKKSDEIGLSDEKLANKRSEFLIKRGYQSMVLGLLEFDELKLKFLTVSITMNGVSGLFLVDSGAGRSMLHSAKVDKYQLKPVVGQANQSTSGAGGVFSLQRYQVGSLQVDGMHLNKDAITAANLSAMVNYIKLKTGQEIDGVIGQDVLTPHQAIIDGAQSVVYLKE